jgi:hypothetical protein
LCSLRATKKGEKKSADTQTQEYDERRLQVINEMTKTDYKTDLPTSPSPASSDSGQTHLLQVSWLYVC